MIKKARVSIVKVIHGIDSNYAVEGVRNSEGKIVDGKFIDSVNKYETVESLDMLFSNIELGKELAMVLEAEDAKVKRLRCPFNK